MKKRMKINISIRVWFTLLAMVGLGVSTTIAGVVVDGNTEDIGPKLCLCIKLSFKYLLIRLFPKPSITKNTIFLYFLL